MKIAVAAVLCLAGLASADIVYTGGTQVSRSYLWTDPAPGAAPERVFEATGGLEPIEAVHDLILTRATPAGLLSAEVGVGYFGLGTRDQYSMSSEMQNTVDCFVPAGSFARAWSEAAITINFTLTQGSVFEVQAMASNSDLGGAHNLTHTTIRITAEGLGTPILNMDATELEQVARFDGFMFLAAGNYTLLLRNEVDFTSSATADDAAAYSRLDFFFDAAPGVCVADVGIQGGLAGRDQVLDNNDFIVFIGMFFAQSPGADMGRQGGLLGADGAWDNNDFVVYIGRFFGGC